MISVFVGTSVDGFLARADDTFDFLRPFEGEPHGYEEFVAAVDAIVIGRRTFEVVLGMQPHWHYGKKRVVVLSSRPVDFSSVKGGVIEQMSGIPAEIVKKLVATGAQNLYVDGGLTIQQFLRAGLVNRLVITRVPILIGQGIPLFGSLLSDIKLQHISTKAFANGMVSSEYHTVLSS
jgi:dihydrofolate reductase